MRNGVKNIQAAAYNGAHTVFIKRGLYQKDFSSMHTYVQNVLKVSHSKDDWVVKKGKTAAI